MLTIAANKRIVTPLQHVEKFKAWQYLVTVTKAKLDRCCLAEGFSECSVSVPIYFTFLIQPSSPSLISLLAAHVLFPSPDSLCVCFFLFNDPSSSLSHTLCPPLFTCCQSEADEDSEMRTQVHWARFMALLSASHHHHHHQMHWAAQTSVTLCPYLHLWLACCCCFCC